MGIFKSYDIRGVYNRDWDKDLAYRIGFFLPSLLETNRILVGRDARESSEEIFRSMGRGIRDAGCDVTDIGMCSTPSVYFATAHFDFGGSVMITASHNPSEYNGLKISRAQAIPVGYDTGLERLEQMIRGKILPASSPGSLDTLDIRGAYLEHLSPYIEAVGSINAVIDCSDGMASVFIHEVIRGFQQQGEIITMYDQPDGTFPHHPPNPLIEANLADLKQRTLAEKADLGICFDGDGDRVMFVDEAGRFISPDLIIALLGLYFFRQSGQVHQGEVVTYDVRTSRSVVEYVTGLGGKPVICKVGHSHAKKLLRDTNGLYGGELAGHYYFRDNYFCDSGMIAALLVMAILSRERRSFSELVGEIVNYHYSGEINFKTNAKERIIEAVRSEYSSQTGARLTDIDGIRLDFPDWWFNLRKSNTEPYLRLVVEAESAEHLSKRTTDLKSRFRALDPEIEEV
jgi:phosphomannomutase